MDWIDMAQDRDRRWAVVSAVMNSRLAGDLVASQEGLCSMELASQSLNLHYVEKFLKQPQSFTL
jgi:hypothetical protein